MSIPYPLNGEGAIAVRKLNCYLSDGVIQYEVSIPVATRHGVRIQCRERNHVFRVEVSPRKLAIVRQPMDTKANRAEVLASQPVKLQPGRWHPLRLTFSGKELTVQVAGVQATASHALLAEPKTAFALMAIGGPVGFRRLVVAK